MISTLRFYRERKPWIRKLAETVRSNYLTENGWNYSAMFDDFGIDLIETPDVLFGFTHVKIDEVGPIFARVYVSPKGTHSQMFENLIRLHEFAHGVFHSDEENAKRLTYRGMEREANFFFEHAYGQPLSLLLEWEYAVARLTNHRKYVAQEQFMRRL